MDELDAPSLGETDTRTGSIITELKASHPCVPGLGLEAAGGCMRPLCALASAVARLQHGRVGGVHPCTAVQAVGTA